MPWINAWYTLPGCSSAFRWRKLSFTRVACGHRRVSQQNWYQNAILSSPPTCSCAHSVGKKLKTACSTLKRPMDTPTHPSWVPLPARSPQGPAGAALMGDTQTCMVTAAGWCWTAALGNWDMPCRLAQPLALPFTCTPDSCVINLLYYLVVVFHISGYHNTASPLDGCSHIQRILPAFYEPRFTGEEKQGSSSAFPQPSEQMGRSTDSSRWVTSPPKSKGGVGWPWHGWTNKGFTCQPLSWWAKKFLVEATRDLQCTSTKVFEVWKCVFILVWKKNQTLQTLPQTVFCCCHCCHWNIWFQTEKIGVLTYIILCL